VVTITVPALLQAQSASTFIYGDTVIPARFRPTSDFYSSSLFVLDPAEKMGTVKIASADGTMSIYVGTSTSFVNAGDIGFKSFSFSYSV
jgi:hypothetical protein